MKKFLGITFVLLLGISLIGGCSLRNQQNLVNSFANNQNSQSIDGVQQPMVQFISTGDKNLDETLNGIDYDLSTLQNTDKGN